MPGHREFSAERHYANMRAYQRAAVRQSPSVGRAFVARHPAAGRR
jgi:hypothetical protein